MVFRFVFRRLSPISAFPDGAHRSSWEHCRDILLEAEKQGFRNILCPSSYQVGEGHAQLCCRLRAADRTDQHAGGSPLR